METKTRYHFIDIERLMDCCDVVITLEKVVEENPGFWGRLCGRGSSKLTTTEQYLGWNRFRKLPDMKKCSRQMSYFLEDLRQVHDAKRKLRKRRES